nr:ArmA_Rmt [uncultured bacterium]
MIDDIVERLLSSKKYSGLCEDTVRRVAEESAKRHKKPKDAEKAARETLHGITGAFMSGDELKRAREYMAQGNIDEALRLHSSTRERMPMDSFYDAVFAVTGRPSRVLDIACGLNPYYLGSIGVCVTGLDINAALMKALNDWAAEAKTPVEAYAYDVLCERPIPEGKYDLALMMKLLPVLENQKKGAALELMRRVPAVDQVITFPTRTLTGRRVGMDRHYTEWFEALLTDEFSVIYRGIINDELVYVIKKRTDGSARDEVNNG